MVEKRKRGRAKASEQPRQTSRLGWLPLLIVGAGLAAYANGFKGPFLFDDIGHILQNEQIRDLWSPSGYLATRRPVVAFSLAVNYAISEYRVWSYHAFNIGVHVLAGLALFGIVRRTLEQNSLLCAGVSPAGCQPAHVNPRGLKPAAQRATGSRGLKPAAQRAEKESTRRDARVRSPAGASASWFAFAAAAIWVVHPLQTQSVSYTVQRGEALMGLFYLLTIYAVLRGADSAKRSRWWYAVAIGASALGMGSKAVMVTAPVVVLLFDRTFIAGSFLEAWRRRWGLYVGLIASWSVLFVCGIVQSVLNPPAGTSATVGLAFTGVTPTEYFLTQPGVLLHYLELSFWPARLCLDYDWPVATTLLPTILSTAGILALLAGTCWAWARKPWLGFLGAWFFVILSPTSSFIPIKDLAFEHRMYLPLAAVIIVTLVLLDGLFHRLSKTSPGQSGQMRFVRVTLVVVVVGALGWRTLERNIDYRTRVTMWQDVVAQRPTNARGHCNLGVALTEEGRHDEAVVACRKAVELDPTFVSGHFRLGQVSKKSGAIQEAIAAYEEAIRLDRNHADAHYDLGNTFLGLGQAPAAVEHYQAALRIDSTYVNAHVNLGNAYKAGGMPDQAIKEYRSALAIKPDFAEARYNLGVTLAGRGRLDEAIAEFRRVVRIDPNRQRAQQALQMALEQQRSSLGN